MHKNGFSHRGDFKGQYKLLLLKQSKKCTKVLNLIVVPSVNLYYRVHVTCTFKIGQGVVKLLMGSHYKLFFDDSAFLFDQREKSFVVYWVLCTLIDTSVKL